MIALRRPKIYRMSPFAILLSTLLLVSACAPATQYDLVIRDGTIYDGSGTPGYVGDVAINGDAIAAIGDIGKATGTTEIDATGFFKETGWWR